MTRSFAESVLSERAGRTVSEGEVAVCAPDLVLGTDGSVPMAIDYFDAMGGGPVAHPERVLFARDHYAPPTSVATRGFHARMVDFAEAHSIELLSVGDGISFLHALEHGRVGAGELIVGGDSHTTTCGVRGALAVGIGSSDLACVLKTGRVWLRVPATVRVDLDGSLPTGVVGKDVALELVRVLDGRIAPFDLIEFGGAGARAMPPEERVVLSNMAAEMGAMAGVFLPPDSVHEPGRVDHHLDLGVLEPMVARPPSPSRGVPVREVAGEPVDWVFVGTCAGGRTTDFREALRVLRVAGGPAPGVTLVVTPPTRRVREALEAEGVWSDFEAMGAVVTETGCGPCCGTSGPLPPPTAKVLSTANRNFTARMGEPTAEIFLGSAATCAAGAAAGRIVDPRGVA